jgi:hypothetical protein
MPRVAVIPSLAACMFLAISACTTAPDARSQMLRSARQSDADFPDGESIKLTSFAYIGSGETPDGEIRVVHERAVLTGMLAPRGRARILYFDRQNRFVDADRPWWLDQHPPLWTNGPRLFLSGAIHEASKEGEPVLLGNALDFSGGIANRSVVAMPAYASLTNLFDRAQPDTPATRNPESSD